MISGTQITLPDILKENGFLLLSLDPFLFMHSYLLMIGVTKTPVICPCDTLNGSLYRSF